MELRNGKFKIEGLIFDLDAKECQMTNLIWKMHLAAECPSFSLL